MTDGYSQVYGSIRSSQSSIDTQQEQLQAARRESVRQRGLGRTQIERLRRVHPRTPPSEWEVRRGEIGVVRGQLSELRQHEQDITRQEEQLARQEKELESQRQQIESYERSGYKVRSSDKGGFEFYKEVPVIEEVPTEFEYKSGRTEEETQAEVERYTKHYEWMGNVSPRAQKQLLDPAEYELKIRDVKESDWDKYIVYEPVKSETPSSETYWENIGKTQPALLSLLVSATPEQNIKLREAVVTGKEEKYTLLSKQIYEQMTPSKKLEYTKKYMLFEGDKTWKQVQKQQPYIELKISKAGEIYTDVNLAKWKEEEYKGLSWWEKGLRFQTARFFRGFADPGYIYESVAGDPVKAEEMVYRWEFETKQAVKEGGLLAYGKQIVFSPPVTNIVIPFTFAGGIGYGLKAVGAAGVATGAKVTTEGIKGGTWIGRRLLGFATKTPYVLAGTITATVGTDIGITAAKYGWTSREMGVKVATYGTQFISAGAGYQWGTSKSTSRLSTDKLTKTYAKVKSFAFEKIPSARRFDIKLQSFRHPSRISTTYYGGGRGLTISEIGRAGSLRGMKADVYTRVQYMQSVGQPKTSFFLPSKMYIKREYGLWSPSRTPMRSIEYTKVGKPSSFVRAVRSFAVERGLGHPKPFRWLDITKLSDAKFMQKPRFSMAKEGLFYRGGYLTFRPTPSEYVPPQYGTDWLRSGAEIDVSIMPKAPVKTFTTALNLSDSSGSFFIKQAFELAPKDFATGHVQPVTVMYGAKKGYTFGIVSGEQTVGGVTTELHGISSGRYIGEVKPDVMVSRMYSRSLNAKMPSSPRSIKVIGGTHKTDSILTTSPEDIALFGKRSFKGTTLSKTYYGGESKTVFDPISKSSFISYDKSADLTLSFTSGKSGGVRTFDVASIVKGRIKKFGKIDTGSEYYGDPGGFDYRLTTKMIDDVIMPGGISTDVGTKINLPSMFDSLSTKQVSSISYDAGVQISSYWKGVSPASNIPVQTNILKLTPLTIISNVQGMNTIPMIKTIQANINLNRDIQSQHLVPISLSRVTPMSLTAQESISSSITKQLQIQQQIQKTQLKQISVIQPMSVHVPLKDFYPPYQPPTYPSIIKQPTIEYKPPPPLRPPPTPFGGFVLPDDTGKKRKRKKMDEELLKGYRFRRWKVPRMEDILGM